MTKRDYDKKCRALFKKAREIGVELRFYPEYFNHKRLNCLWYGGELATIKVSEKLTVELDIYGDVYACLFDRNGDVLVRVKDKNNMGVFGDEMLPYLKTDKQLRKAIDSGKLEFDYNNWIEYDGVIRKNTADERGTFIDLGVICDNILDDNILTAIEQALDSIKEIKKEILGVAKRNYGIKVGAA